MKYFYRDIELEVPEMVYCPGEDSELMAGVLEDMELIGVQALDMGCGSGLLSIVMAKKGAHVTAADINETAVLGTLINAEKNKVQVKGVVSDMFEKVGGQFDLITFNAPYLPEEEGEERDIIYSGGKTGREIIEAFFKDAKQHLAKGGSIFIAFSSLTGKDETEDLIKSQGYRIKEAAKRKIDWEELIVVECASN